MPERGERTRLPLAVTLDGAAPEDVLEGLQAYVFDRLGKLVGQAALKVARGAEALEAKGEIELDPKLVARGARLVLVPEAAAKEIGRKPVQGTLETRFDAFTEPFRIDPRDPRLLLRIPRESWITWPRLCACRVRGRLVKRVQLPDGSTRDLPICNARVTLCEVDRWPLLIERLPESLLDRLRIDLSDLIRQPIPRPPIPEPEPWPGPLPELQLGRRIEALPVERPNLSLSVLPRPALQAGLALRRDLVPKLRLELAERLELAQGPDLRGILKAEALSLRPYLCDLLWLERWFALRRVCFATVTTDEDGRFSAVYVHACGDDDRPDIHVSAQQFLGGAWTTIHAPSLRCGTHWDYECGSELTVVVTDPRAMPCIPDDPVDPPDGVERWVMPYQVGAMTIAGAGGTPPASGWPGGWVKPSGRVDYGGGTDAPFGSVLGFRQQHSISIPDAGAFYYRWSWRPGMSGPFNAMDATVTRTFVRDLPGAGGVSFPAVLLGPQPNGLFRFKSASFAPGEWGVDTSADPAGTTYYWPIDAGIGDLYAARWTTPGTAPVVPDPAGPFQVRLDVFDQAGNPVAPGPGTFRFIVPSEVDSTGTLQTRLAAASELDGTGFVFTLQVDNGRCASAVTPPSVSAGTNDADCGFLRYDPGATAVLGFEATHPRGEAGFTVGVVRGATGVGFAGVAGAVPVGAASAGVYARIGPAFVSAPLALGPPASPSLLGTCPAAAFAMTVSVYAKATDGVSRLQQYDSYSIRAFAFAPVAS